MSKIKGFKEWLKEQEMANDETMPPEMMDKDQPPEEPTKETPPDEPITVIPKKKRVIFRSLRGIFPIPFPRGIDNNLTRGRTSSDEGVEMHFHLYKVNTQGDGKTTKTSAGPNHTHEIEKLIVKPAGSVPHTHKLQ